MTILPPGAIEVATRIAEGLDQAEWHISCQIVADITLVAPARANRDGSVSLTLEALTIAE